MITSTNHLAVARKMASPTDLREFQEDFDTICGAGSMALEFMGHEDARARADAGMKRCRLAWLQCGRAFWRIRHTESWKDRFETWEELCRAAGKAAGKAFSPKVVCRMMAGARAYDGLPPESQKALGVPSGRNLTLLAKADQETRLATAQQAAASGDPDDAFADLRRYLHESPEKPLDECEAPKVQRAEHSIAAVKRHVTMLVNCLVALGVSEEEANETALGEVVRLAEGAVACAS